MARQYAIRMRLAACQPSSPCLDLAAAQVRPTARETAAAAVTLHEPMPAIVTHSFGLFFGETLASVCCFELRAEPSRVPPSAAQLQLLLVVNVKHPRNRGIYLNDVANGSGAMRSSSTTCLARISEAA
jgi:hypothetical protein